MYQLMVVFLLAAVTESLPTQSSQPLLEFDPTAGDFELNVVQHGQISTVTLKDEVGQVSTTEILEKEDFEVEKPEGMNVCYVRSLNEDYEGRDCKQLTTDQVPQAVVERCGDRPMYYALTQCKNNDAMRQKRGVGCSTKCSRCGWRLCCRLSCSASFG